MWQQNSKFIAYNLIVIEVYSVADMACVWQSVWTLAIISPIDSHKQVIKLTSALTKVITY